MSDRPEVSLRRFEPGDGPAVHRWFNTPAATASLMEQRSSFSLEQGGRAAHVRDRHCRHRRKPSPDR